MKKFLTLICALALATLALAQASKKSGAPQKRSGRDLFLSKEEPGVKMTIELLRNGKTEYVRPDTEFRAGDKVAFHFEVNFNGYVAVLAQGSSGKKSLLFPYPGTGNQIPANQTYRIPASKNWFEFDNHTGEEKLLFVMSTNPIPGINQTTGNVTSNSGSSGGPASGDQEQQILDEINSRAMRKSKGRDLNLVKDQSDSYVTTSQQALAEPIGIPVVLIHK